MNDSRFKLPEEAVRLQSGELLVGGGNKDAELFDPPTTSFIRVPGQMTEARHFMTETLLQNGTVLFAGGYANNDVATAQTWIYQP